MLSTWLMMLWGLLAEAWSARRDARVRLLMAQIEMLRTRVPGNRVIVTPQERLRLLKLSEAVRVTDCHLPRISVMWILCC